MPSFPLQLDGKVMHVNLTPFLEKNTSLFMKELWTLLASANQTSSHIPQQLLEAQKAKLEAQQKAQQTIQVRLRV
jgi:serine/arginine repetitive matrix protein 1